MTSLFVYLAIAVCSLVVAYFKCLYRKQRPGEPPLVPGHWLFGNSVEFSKHAQRYLTKARQEYGDIFTVRLAARFWTAVLDIHSFDKVCQMRSFDFTQVVDEVNGKVFQFNLKNAKKMTKDAGHRVNGKSMLKFMENFDKNLHRAFDETFPVNEYITNVGDSRTSINNVINANMFTGVIQNSNHILSPLNTAIEKPIELNQKFDSMVTTDEWTEGDLRELCGKIYFSAIFYTLFGRTKKEPYATFNPHTFIKNLDTFNEYFSLMFLGIPRKLFPKANRAGLILGQQPDSNEMLERDGISDYVTYTLETMKQNGQSEAEMKGYNVVLLHVNFNSFRAAFWCAYKLMEKPQALAAIRKELQEAVDMKRSGYDAEKTVDFTYEEINKLPLLDSFIKEIIRFTGGVFMTRQCTADTRLTLDSGRQVDIRNGDRVVVVPAVFHKDPEIFHDPEEFIYDRFVDAEFFKNGKKVKNPVIGFGALCPGKKLSIVEIKWFVMNLINTFKMELLPGEATSPDTDLYGQEIISPKNPVQVRMKRKEGVASFRFVQNHEQTNKTSSQS